MELVPAVPAWKRLGLQLKTVADTPSFHEDPSPSKKSKKRKRQLDDTSHGDGEKVVEFTAKQKQEETGTSISTRAREPHSKRTKSVAFTQDTKTTDGDSIKQLFQAWVKQERAKDPSFRPEKAGDAFKVEKTKSIPVQNTLSSFDDKNLAKRKDKKKAAKGSQHQQKKSTGDDKTKDSSPQSHPALIYLLQHHHSRQDWKFSKVRQSYLLKHVLDLKRIPSKYTIPLCHYFAGLQGQGVRDRLITKMEQVLDENLLEQNDDQQRPETQPEPASKTNNGNQEPNANAESNPELEVRLAKLEVKKRAKAILKKIEDSGDVSEDEGGGDEKEGIEMQY
ncbi:MAG: hypothetical protein M1823_001016 [Watsoniomyces obsoletus]|nr:MAG: hypothetical protein M1823_001016 [Watsoniomyces obsoletus]